VNKTERVRSKAEINKELDIGGPQTKSHSVGRWISIILWGQVCDLSSKWWGISSKLPARGREYDPNLAVCMFTLTVLRMMQATF
jgi:hypothetical protein